METTTTYKINLFKRELMRLNASEALMDAIAGKTQKRFIAECDNPALIHEFLILKSSQKGWLSKRKINRRLMYCAFFDTALFFLRGKKGLAMIKSHILKANLPADTQLSNSLSLTR